jgi:hypothetical protein
MSIFIPPTAPQSPLSIIWGWYNRPVMAAVPSGLSLTALKIIIKENNKIYRTSSIALSLYVYTGFERGLPDIHQAYMTTERAEYSDETRRK